MTDQEENVTSESSTSLIQEVPSFDSSLTVNMIIRAVVAVIILVLNVAVIHCINKWTRLKRATRNMFLNLAASDILFGISTSFNALFIVPQLNWMTKNICWISFTFSSVSRCACSTGITLLAFDIFANTVLSKASNTTPWYLRMHFIGTVIGISWFLLGVLGTWMAVDISSFMYGCDPIAFFTALSGKVTVLAMAVQSMISTVFFAMTFGIASHRIRKFKSCVNPENLFQTAQSVKRLQREMKIAKIALALGVLYLVSHGPSIMTVTAMGVFDVSVPFELVLFTGVLVYFNSMGNCIIYWWRSLEFRKIWGQMLSCKSTNSVNPD